MSLQKQEQNFTYQKIVKLCLHLKKLHRTELLSFDEFISHKIKDSNFGLYVTKTSGNFR